MIFAFFRDPDNWPYQLWWLLYPLKKNCLLKNYAAQHNNYILIDNTFFVLALPATFFCSLFRGAPCQNVKSQIQRMVKVIGSNFFDFFEMSDFDPCKKAAVMVKRRRRNRFWTCQSTLIRKSGSSSRVAVKLKAFSRGEFKIWTSFSDQRAMKSATGSLPVQIAGIIIV